MLSVTLDELKTIIPAEYCNLPPCSLTLGQITGFSCLYLQHFWCCSVSGMLMNMTGFIFPKVIPLGYVVCQIL